jgi:serine/threonine-protein kinase
MYLLLAGSPVREPGSMTEQLLGAMTRPVPSLGTVSSLPRSVVAVVDRALAFHREDRFPDARSMQLAVRAVLSELSPPDSRATLPPPSVEPMALSLRTPRPDGRYRPSSIPTVRPVASTAASPGSAANASPSALSVYVSLGFAVGLGIVLAARLTVHASPTSTAARPQRIDSAPFNAPSAPKLELTQALPPSPASAVAAASTHRLSARPPQRPPSDPLSRRK